MWILLVFIIFLLYIWILIRWHHVKNYWAKRNVPHQPPHPLLGNLAFWRKENPAVWIRRLYKEFQSPYVGVWLLWQPALIINSPEIAKNILIRDFEVFKNRYASSGKNDPIGSLNLFIVNDPIWSSMRRRLTSVFTSAKLKIFQQIPQIKSKQLVERIIADSEKGIQIHLRELFTDYTTDVFGETVFGMRSDSIISGDSALRKITKELMRFNFVRGLTWSCIFFCPNLVNLFGLSMFPKNTVIFLTEIFRAMVQQRGGYDKEVIEMKSLFDALVKIKQQSAKEGKEMSEDLLIAQAAIFLQGGFETTATTLTFAIYEMAFQPHIQENLYQELIDAKSSNSNKLNAQKLSELPYLNAVLKESLRKYPILGTLDRVASKDYKVDENLTIPAGTVVYVNTVGMQSSADYFPRPEKFDPERFMPGNEELVKPYTYMPFGTGPRHCIGERFANQSMRFVLSSLILNFKFWPLPGAPKPDHVEIEKNGLLLSPGPKISVQFMMRN